MDIFVYDEFEPEANAMLQALYSRSSKSVNVHVNSARAKGSSDFMKSFYVGYGHSSIGDCGTTTLYIENVSILACKAIQDNPLYSGQETSTRYIDFSKQELVDPINSKHTKDILENWIAFYSKLTEDIIPHLKKKFPLKKGEDANLWEKTIAARGFDILRGFLPAGVCSQLSWTTNLRQAHENINRMSYHPLKEIRAIANGCLSKLMKKYPSSFSHRKYQEQENYMKKISEQMTYLIPLDCLKGDEDFYYETDINNKLLESEAFNIISQRPKNTNLPRFISKFGRYKCTFLIDYGSFRDLQRHRNGLCEMPLLTDRLGINQWYLEQLPNKLQEEVKAFLEYQFSEIRNAQSKFSISIYDLQYYLPMALNVYCELYYDLPEMIYVSELRSSKTVHPTLRNIAQKMGKALKKEHPNLKLYVDFEHDDWDIKRGKQDIQKR